MDKVLDVMVTESDQMMVDLKYVQSFDFENSTEEELEKFHEFLQNRIKHTEQVKRETRELRKKIKDVRKVT